MMEGLEQLDNLDQLVLVAPMEIAGVMEIMGSKAYLDDQGNPFLPTLAGEAGRVQMLMVQKWFTVEGWVVPTFPAEEVEPIIFAYRIIHNTPSPTILESKETAYWMEPNTKTP